MFFLCYSVSIISSSPYLTMFALSLIIIPLALMIGFNHHETVLLEDRVYATIVDAGTNSNADLDSLHNIGGSITGSNSSAILNSSLVDTVTSENTFQNDTTLGNSTTATTPVYINTSTGPPPGSLQIPYTGLSRYHVTPEVAKLFGLNDTTYAIIVTEVEPRSPAAFAGIRGGNLTTNVAGDTIKLGGDIILKVDGNDTFIRTNEAFLNYLRNEKRVGDNISLAVLRDGQISDVQVTIGALPRFLWYEDTDEGIRIKYPSDWEVLGSESREEVVKFFSPQRVRAGDDTVPVAGIFVVTATTANRGLDDLATEEQEDTAAKRNLDITLTTVSNLPGYESVFYDYSDGNRTLKQLNAFTVKDGGIYRINFATDPSRFDDYLALAREVIRSFQFTK
ncbi:MAG: PDZ domain-containing protein [Nitrososphaeraceae archaeon]|nr:PDZ domain-containing protein [Nitrososphaeraceae archaeon]